MGKNFLGDLFSKKVTKRRPIWAKSLLWGLSILKGDPFGNTAYIHCYLKTAVFDGETLITKQLHTLM